MLIRKNILKMYLKTTAIVALVSFFFIVLATAQTNDSTKMPDTPAGKIFTAFLAAFNTGDIEKIHSFHAEHGDPSKADQDVNLFNQSGALKPQNIIKSSDYEIEVLVQTMKSGEWLGFTMKVSATAPYRIEGLRIRPASASEKTADKKVSESSSTTKKLTDSEIASSFGAYLDGLVKEDKFSGVVLIAKDNKPIFEKAYGLANKAKNIPNDIETKFNLGSINKIFTTIAIAQLMEKGKLSIDDPIGKYLDMFPPEIANKVTIRHLLNMKSGWGDYWSNEYFRSHKDQLKTVSDYMKIIKNIPLDFEPGSNFQHCNTGFEVAGAIIEKVSGMDYFDYVKKNIYEPEGMSNTDSYPRDGLPENLAVGYTNAISHNKENKGYNVDASSLLPARGTPAGGGYSTVEDLLKFDQALRNNRLLKPDYTQYLINRFEGSIGDHSSPDKPSIAAGAFPGVSTFLDMDFKSSYTIIVLSNYDPPVATGVAEETMRTLGIE